MSRIVYIHPDNPQERLIQQVVEVLNNGGVIVYPTDSGYALGCKIGEKRAIDKICRIRQIESKHNFTIVCRDLSELSLYALVTNIAFRLIKNNTPGSYTFILKATKEVPRRLMNDKRKTIGIRVPNNIITLALLKMLEEPLMSTTLILPNNEYAESDPDEILALLKHNVDLILHGGYLGQNPTTVIDLTEDTPTILRHGNGSIEPFI